MPVIPIYRERIGTPTPPEPVLAHAVPTQDYLGQALTGLGEAGQKLQDILTIQKAHAEKLKVAQISNDFQRDLADDEVAAKAQPGTEWGATFLAAGTTRYNELLADPKNADVADTLKLQLPTMLSSGYKSLVVGGASQTEAEQRAQLKALAGTYTGQAGAAYDPKTFEDTKAAQAPMDKLMGLVVDMWPNNKPMQDALMLGFIRDKEMAQAKDVAIHHPEVMGDFLDTHPGIPIQDTATLRSMAAQSLNAPSVEYAARNNRLRMYLVDDLEKRVAAGDKSAVATAIDLHNRAEITGPDFNRIVGTPADKVDTPGAYEQHREEIINNLRSMTPEIINTFPDLSGASKAKLTQFWRERSRASRDPVFEAIESGVRDIRTSGNVNMVDEQLLRTFAPKELAAIYAEKASAYRRVTAGKSIDEVHTLTGRFQKETQDAVDQLVDKMHKGLGLSTGTSKSPAEPPTPATRPYSKDELDRARKAREAAGIR